MLKISENAAAAIIARFLKARGVQRVFGLCGGHIMPIWMQIDAQSIAIVDVRDERAAEVRAAIRQLPPKQRATLILRIYHDLPHDEIASILGSSVGAAKANLFHALANMKKLLR